MRQLVSLLALGSIGCSSLSTVQGGYQQPYDEDVAPGHRGTTINVHMGQGTPDVPVGLDMSLRMKFGADQGQWAIGGGLYAFTPPATVGAFGRAGINALQFEIWDRSFVFGMGSPWAEAGLYILPNGHHLGGFAVTVSASTGYDFRFGGTAPDTGWWSAMIGFGFLTYVPR